METLIRWWLSSVFQSFPDYFKSELMETLLALLDLPTGLKGFPDYFKSELMETLLLPLYHRWRWLSRLLQIGINGNCNSFPVARRIVRLRNDCFPDYFKSELMETILPAAVEAAFQLSRLLQIGINGNN